MYLNIYIDLNKYFNFLDGFQSIKIRDTSINEFS